jgi:hypothetical protein
MMLDEDPRSVIVFHRPIVSTAYPRSGLADEDQKVLVG